MGFEDLRDFGYHQMMHPDEIPVFRAQLAEAAAQGIPLESEIRFKDINGQFRWHLNIASPVVNDDGEIIMWVGSTTDIQRIKEEDQRKSDFIGMVSHELKTPLTSLNAYLQVLEAKFKKSDDQFARRSLEQSLKQVRKMTAMINGFLNISRLESGQIPINKTRFDITEMFRDVEAEFTPMNSSHTITFDCVASVEVTADRDKIGQVISNLVSNAAKYSKPNTTVRVACEAGQNLLKVSVSDEGMGIRPHDLKHIFERYYRADNHGNISGFGIGLYLCAEIIKRHQGRIWAESEVGEGSVFYFSLPLS
jgi:signal transduction histidine kinase